MIQLNLSGTAIYFSESVSSSVQWGQLYPFRVTEVLKVPLERRTHSLKVLDNYKHGPKGQISISAFSAHFQSPSCLYCVLVLGCAQSQHTKRKEGEGKKSEVLSDCR